MECCPDSDKEQAHGVQFPQFHLVFQSHLQLWRFSTNIMNATHENCFKKEKKTTLD